MESRLPRVRCDRTAAWAQLQAHAQKSAADFGDFDMRAAFASDTNRFTDFSLQAPHLFADLSKNRIDRTANDLLLALAGQCGVAAQRDAMFAGEAINGSENRAVMHFLLRKTAASHGIPAQAAIKSIAENAPLEVPVQRLDLSSEWAQTLETRSAMLAFAERIRADSSITDIVNIGIGGSDLGPQMVVQALHAFAQGNGGSGGNGKKRFHFVSNVDSDALAGALADLRPENTLFLIASKTFTTAETMANAQSAKRWFKDAGGFDVAAHFAALTTNILAANAFGITTTFGFKDWVGGRYSLWSAIGLPIAIAIGKAHFSDFLAGAEAMDQHFCDAPLALNLPVRLGLLDVWNRNFLGFSSRSIAPYSQALARWPAFLQQLEMESNGKQVDKNGKRLPFDTAPVIWGEPGTNGQHAYFQMLHQGTTVTPVEFVAVKHPADNGLPESAAQHRLLLANALAQAQALMQGKQDAGGHKNFGGNRPSTFLLLEALTPASLGALIALHEHRVFVSGAVWGINSFDQWGVELGKVLAQDIAQRWATGNTEGMDASTAGLLARLAS